MIPAIGMVVLVLFLKSSSGYVGGVVTINFGNVEHCTNALAQAKKDMRSFEDGYCITDAIK